MDGDKKYVTFRNTEEKSESIIETSSAPLTDKNTNAPKEVGLGGNKT